jgi:hypothetical protein
MFAWRRWLQPRYLAKKRVWASSLFFATQNHNADFAAS